MSGNLIGGIFILAVVAVLAHLDGIAESAQIIGAVNCVVRRGDG